MSELKKLQKILTDLMPFVLEDYFPACATPEYKAAVEAAIRYTKQLKRKKTDDNQGS